jgi:hypothetical protein
LRIPEDLGLKAAVGVGLVALMSIYPITEHLSSYTVTAKVTKTWVQYTKEGSVNLIGTDKGVFEDRDSIGYLKFNSSDYYSNMQDGKTYTFEVTGWRIPFLSAYPNIVSCDDCQP